MEDEPKPGFQQPDGSAESTVKLPGEDLTRTETVRKEASREQYVVDNAKAGINEEPAATKGTNGDAGEAFKRHKKEAPPQKQSNEQREDAEPIGPTPKEAADANISEDTNMLGDSKFNVKEQLGYEKKPGSDSSKGDSFQSMDKNSVQNEKSTGECLSPSVTTDEETEKVDHSLKIDHQANDERQGNSKGEPSENEKPVDTTPKELSRQSVTSDADLAKGECLPSIDSKPVLQAEETNDTDADDHISPRATTDEEKEKVDHSLKIDHQADDEQRGNSKGEPSENEKPVNTTPEELSCQSVTSDLAKGDYLTSKDSKPGLQAKETNITDAVDYISLRATTAESRTCSLQTPPSNKGDALDKSKAGIGGKLKQSKTKNRVLRTSQRSEDETSKEEIEKKKKNIRKEKQDVETIGPTTTQAEPAKKTGILGGGIKLLLGVAVVALVAILVQHLLQSKAPPQKTHLGKVDVFLKQMEKVKARFHNQRAELWSRSEIHLKRHLQTRQPAEPVSLILTSGLRAERTMRCLAQDVASAFSSALNASVLHIDGAAKASQDSDQVKLDIDKKLQGAFEGDKPVAVIHRLEELPPGSTLIFYRYCDHENAAYKKTFLIFTVLLGDEEEIPAEMRLSVVEEMVDDHLQKKFLSHSHPVSFDRMDLNKYGGLWSRISHLILPVAAEERIEHEGC